MKKKFLNYFINGVIFAGLVTALIVTFFEQPNNFHTNKKSISSVMIYNDSTNVSLFNTFVEHDKQKSSIKKEIIQTKSSVKNKNNDRKTYSLKNTNVMDMYDREWEREKKVRYCRETWRLLACVKSESISNTMDDTVDFLIFTGQNIDNYTVYQLISMEEYRDLAWLQCSGFAPVNQIIADDSRIIFDRGFESNPAFFHNVVFNNLNQTTMDSWQLELTEKIEDIKLNAPEYDECF